jgi:imidazole glycerol-phosphate synthase subunit HisF
VKNGRVVKGVRFSAHQLAGDILELAQRYRDEGADELVFYDISASPAGTSVESRWVHCVAKILDIPFCVAGGISSIADAERVLNDGADKISINSPALANPPLIEALSKRFGCQCVVVGIDSRATPDGHHVWQYTGHATRAGDTGRRVIDWVHEIQERGAGEIVLNCMGHDGVRKGYEIEHLQEIRAICQVPLVASGGAGALPHFEAVFRHAGVDAALAASVFHSRTIAISELKQYLRNVGICVRAVPRQSI